ncbi:uncharacterized protein [Macrobrachium rosenbergii]|uniref:uncharacterized protein n=1 Tax=Macrobrachium rosenbergii TaxID=79674 RepID=UPI0034D482C9
MVLGGLPSLWDLKSHSSVKDVLYSYGYVVDAPEYRNFYDHEEDRRGDVTQGRFRVALPDNRLQTVTYRAGRKGYSAQISYDEHPDFQSLRASVGPIREAPQIGQAVVSIPRRGENWKNRDSHSHQEISNIVDSPTSRRKPSAFSRPSPAVPLPSPTPVQPAPAPFKPRTTATQRPQRNGQSTHRFQGTPTTASRLGPIAQRLVSTPLNTRVTTQEPLAPQVLSSAHMPEDASIFVSTEGLEDPEILNRLIEAIRLKQEEDQLSNPESNHDDDDDDSHEHSHKKEKPRYTIGDKAAVRDRLRAIVHRVPIGKL